MTCTLGIDTSCYRTSAALACGDKVLCQRRRLLPVPVGERGLRQSEAVFAHMKQLPQLVEDMMKENTDAIHGICVSKSPCDGDDSYMPVFLAGLSLGRSLAAVLHVPLFTTTHQRGHIRAALVDSGMEDEKGPFLAVHLSGGTTDILYVHDGKIDKLGSSLDLHAGQLVDRIGVKMGLAFPCGPYLEELAVKAKAQSVLPVSIQNMSCHLSGAETQLLHEMEKGMSNEQAAAEVYSVLNRTVLRMLTNAKKETGVSRVLIAGGVASSDLFRREILKRNEERRLALQLHFGKPEYSGDNACGVALIGEERLHEEEFGWQL